jgi:hypothetical protein
LIGSPPLLLPCRFCCQLVANMFDQVAVALLLLAGITVVYVIFIGQSQPDDRETRKADSTGGH